MRFIAYSNIWISIAGVAQLYLTYQLTGIPVYYPLIGFVLFSILFTYNFLRIIKVKNISPENHSEQLIWISRHLKLITWIMIFSFIGSLTFFFFLYNYQKILILFSGLFAVGYNIPIWKRGITLRSIPYLKSVWICLIWTITTFLLPINQNEFEFPIIDFFIRFLFFYVITIPFDIRDLKYDDVKMKTTPQLFGKVGALILGIILLVTCACTAFEIYLQEIALIYLVSYFLTGIVLLFSLKERKEIFYPMVVDGMILVQAVLMVGWILFKI